MPWRWLLGKSEIFYDIKTVDGEKERYWWQKGVIDDVKKVEKWRNWWKRRELSKT